MNKIEGIKLFLDTDEGSATRMKFLTCEYYDTFRFYCSKMKKGKNICSNEEDNFCTSKNIVVPIMSFPYRKLQQEF